MLLAITLNLGLIYLAAIGLLFWFLWQVPGLFNMQPQTDKAYRIIVVIISILAVIYVIWIIRN